LHTKRIRENYKREKGRGSEQRIIGHLTDDSLLVLHNK